MENNKGYVYVMINPSYEGLVKIGKTTREPEERAKELSASTSVPTPFVVVYKRLFKNCHVAEMTAHEILGERGYRINDSREFFSVSISDAIDIILQISDDDSFKQEDDIIEQCNINFDNSKLADSYYELAEEYYNGHNGKFQDVDKALFYYEKSVLLGCDKSYENIGDIWLDRDDPIKALQYYKKAVENHQSNCYAKMAKIYMNEQSSTYNRYNATLAWSKYFEYLDRQKKSLLVQSEFSAFFVGLNLYDYFKNYLSLHEAIPNEHINFIKTNKYAIIAVFHALVEMNNKFSQSLLLNRYITESIFPYLFNVDGDKTFYVCEEAQNLLQSNGNGNEDTQKALELFIQSEEEGSITATAYISICYYKMGQVDKADKSLHSFYNSIYDLIVGELFPIITDEQKQILLDAFFQIFYILTKENRTDLIHKFYYMAAWQLGFREYLVAKLALLAETIISTINNLTEGLSQTTESEYISKEHTILSQIANNAQKVIDECQGQNWEKPHRLDI